jgi:thioesterase domain-containing protein
VDVWRDLAASSTVIETSGTHLTMLARPHAEATAAALTRCLPTAPGVDRPDR